MTTSADIRKDNKKRIYKQMLDRKTYTKQRIASITGLSVATCNTLLNDMLASGVLSIGSEKELHGVGRGSALYSVNDRHECYLLVILSARNRQKTVECSLVSATGDIIRQNRSAYSVLNPADILKMMKDTANGYPYMNQIVVSVPGVVDGDEIIKHNVIYDDLPDLSDSDKSGFGIIPDSEHHGIKAMATSNYIYAVRLGNVLQEGSGSVPPGFNNAIEVFDWDGNLLRRYITDRPFVLFSAAADDSSLITYGLSDEETQELSLSVYPLDMK